MVTRSYAVALLIVLYPLGFSQGQDAGPITTKVAVAFEAFGTPKYDQRLKERGFIVIFNTVPPKDDQKYDVALYVQREISSGQWAYVPVAPNPQFAVYRSGATSGVFDVIQDVRFGTVSFFVPHRIIKLDPGFHNLRFKARFFDENRSLMPQHDTDVGPFRLKFDEVQGRISRTVYANSPVELFEVE